MIVVVALLILLFVVLLICGSLAEQFENIRSVLVYSVQVLDYPVPH